MRHLHRDLERLKRRILSMGSLVESAIDTALTALVERRPSLAEEVVSGDDRIDDREVEIEDECLKMLALHQPVAQDLRFIVTTLKVNNDLERMGDLARNVAERAAFLCSRPSLDSPPLLTEIAERVRRMIREALDALVSQDTVLARGVIKSDEEVDKMHRRMYAVVEDWVRADPDRLERALHILSTSRHLERMADLATNIAEDVVFLVEGAVIRHGRDRGPRGRT
jgi:phosphate transport system protein